MFAAPPAVTAEVFCRIPDKFRRFGETTEWAQVQLHGAAAPVFLEGPVFDADGNLWVTDIPWGRMFKIAPDGSCEVGFEYDGQPNGMKFLTDGRLLVADHHKGMVLCDPKTGKSEPWFDRYLLEPFLGCNDLTIANRLRYLLIIKGNWIILTHENKVSWAASLHTCCSMSIRVSECSISIAQIEQRKPIVNLPVV